MIFSTSYHSLIWGILIRQMRGILHIKRIASSPHLEKTPHILGLILQLFIKQSQKQREAKVTRPTRMTREPAYKKQMGKVLLFINELNYGT